MLAQSEICSSWWTKYLKMADLGNNFSKGFWMSSKNKRLATKKRRQVSWVWKCSQSCQTTNHKHVLSKPEINHSMLSSSWRSHCCNWFLRFFSPPNHRTFTSFVIHSSLFQLYILWDFAVEDYCFTLHHKWKTTTASYFTMDELVTLWKLPLPCGYILHWLVGSTLTNISVVAMTIVLSVTFSCTL